jgi:hypothetical protein
MFKMTVRIGIPVFFLVFLAITLFVLLNDGISLQQLSKRITHVFKDSGTGSNAGLASSSVSTFKLEGRHRKWHHLPTNSTFFSNLMNFESLPALNRRDWLLFMEQFMLGHNKPASFSW